MQANEDIFSFYSGDSKKITRAYFDRLLLETRYLDSVVPDSSCALFGVKFKTPITTTALSHLSRFNPDLPNGMEAYAAGAALADTLHFVGMCENDEYASISNTGAKCVRIVKPYADEDKIFSQLMFAKENGAVAVGMDVDHTFSSNGQEDIVMGEPMSVKSLSRMKDFISATDLPFVVKGVLSVHDAKCAAELGASAIIISHHGGKMRYSVPPLLVLQDIVREVGKELTIFVDCGVQSGMDVYKAMALGAKAVGVGNHLIQFLKSGGAQAVADRIGKMTEELMYAMANTGVKNTSSFTPDILHLI